MKITMVKLRQLSGAMPVESEFWEERLRRPIDIYPEHRFRLNQPASLTTDAGLRYPIQQIFVEIETDEGVTGLGGPMPANVAVCIDAFRWLLIGADPIATERLWDLMYRHAIHGRKGVEMLAISALDCALWDLRGKAAGLPVYRLLGGPVRETMPAYASMLGYSLEPDKVKERAQWLVEQGFKATKWFPRDGPTDGRAGMDRIMTLAETLRETMGPDADLMFDAWSSWDVPYTIAMSERLAEVNARWIEEPVLADKLEQCAEIRRRSRVPIATGEHEYTRWGLSQLMQAGAADVIQADTYWAGGISEMLKIATLVSVHDLVFIPHGHSVPANVHLTAALPPNLAPMIEYLVKWNAINQFFLKNPVTPVEGMLTVPHTPGMGMELDEAKIERETEFR